MRRTSLHGSKLLCGYSMGKSDLCYAVSMFIRTCERVKEQGRTKVRWRDEAKGGNVFKIGSTSEPHEFVIIVNTQFSVTELQSLGICMKICIDHPSTVYSAFWDRFLMDAVFGAACTELIKSPSTKAVEYVGEGEACGKSNSAIVPVETTTGDGLGATVFFVYFFE